MQKIPKVKLKIKYEENSKINNLVISFDSKEKIFEYQIDMIANNAIEKLLPFQAIRKDSQISFNYNVTSKVSLSKFLRNNTLKRKEFIDILLSVADIICSCGSYLLSDRCLLLDEDYIYIDKETKNISMVYVPANINEDVTGEIKEFVMRLVMIAVRIDDECRDNFIQRILEKIKEDTFDIEGFKNLLLELSGRKKVTIKPENTYVTKEKLSICEDNTDFSEPKQELKNLQGIIAAVCMQIIIFGIIAILYLCGAFNYFGSDWMTPVIVLLIILGIDYIIVKRIINLNKNKENSFKIPIKRELIKIERPSVEKDEKVNDNHKSATENKKIKDEKNDETVLLVNTVEKIPYLKSTANNDSEDITIKGNKFIIGRLEEQVDYYIKNNSVGKIHAEISKIGNKYFIKDLNSKNGTYLNNEKLEAEKEVIINNNDKIVFANCEYQYFENK